MSCDDTSESADPLHQRLLQSWGEDVLLPWYREFEAKTDDLHTRALDFCAEPSSDGLLDVQQAWGQARAPWKQAESFAFGPYADFSLQLGAKIDFWPVRPATVDDLIEGTDELSADALAILGAPAKGLPAIEYVLYPADQDALGVFDQAPRRCEYLLAASEQLASDATEIREAWDPKLGDYLGQLTLTATPSEAFESLQAALSEVVGKMASLVEVIQATKLGKPIGGPMGGDAQPEFAESRFSERSVQDIRDNLNGLEKLYQGGDAERAIGLEFAVAERGRSDLDAAFQEALSGVRAALERIPEPFSEAVVIDQFTVIDTIDELRALQAFFQVEVARTLSLTLVLFDNDGD